MAAMQHQQAVSAHSRSDRVALLATATQPIWAVYLLGVPNR